MKEAGKAFGKVLELSQGEGNMVRFNLASVLRLQGRSSEALNEARVNFRLQRKRS